MPKLAPQETRTFFLTLVTANRRRIFQVHATAQLLLDLFENDRSKNRYAIHAFVIMPDHVHVLLTPAEDVSFEKTVQFIKGGFSFRLKSKLDVWQKGYNEHRITDGKDFAQHIIYIHENPMEARLVPDYPFTSAKMPHLVDPAPHHLTTPAKALFCQARIGGDKSPPSHRKAKTNFPEADLCRTSTGYCGTFTGRRSLQLRHQWAHRPYCTDRGPLLLPHRIGAIAFV